MTVKRSVGYSLIKSGCFLIMAGLVFIVGSLVLVGVVLLIGGGL